jgi:hypothetical protein
VHWINSGEQGQHVAKPTLNFKLLSLPPSSPGLGPSTTLLNQLTHGLSKTPYHIRSNFSLLGWSRHPPDPSWNTHPLVSSSPEQPAHTLPYNGEKLGGRISTRLRTFKVLATSPRVCLADHIARGQHGTDSCRRTFYQNAQLSVSCSFQNRSAQLGSQKGQAFVWRV